MKRALSIQEVAETLGVSRPTIYRLIDRGELSVFKVGRRALVEVAELDRFISDNTTTGTAA